MTTVASRWRGWAVALAGDSSGRRRRSTRDWIVDTAFFLLASAYGVIAAGSLSQETTLPTALVIADQVAGALGCAALWLRRRWPVALALVLVGLSTFSLLIQGAVVVALFTVAIHRPLPIVAGVGALSLVVAPVYSALRPDPTLTYGEALVLSTVVYFAVTGWGMFVRSRRQLIESLWDRANRAEADARLRAEQAERVERDRIAREVHDVLAHRLSLLSLYAGALEYRPDMSPAEVARVAAVVRENSHKALQDVREVIGVLRAPTGEQPDSFGPQPTLARLPQLVDESRLVGVEVVVHNHVGDLGDMPEALGRTAYRITQEGLTNVRKHAPGAAVTAMFSGSPDEGLTVELRNPVPPPGTADPTGIPGTGQGLIGLAERATLAHGRLEYGHTESGDFRLSAWLPWTP